ncbi:MAG: histidine triad nucleotide-binding protein [Oscillospiraceae bacterium]|jgi:histidine triad (HIT) family protein|nr:histidine triad nucleotide-binding protein [Oscillospiraceae bacterium]
MDDCVFCKIIRGEIPSDKVYEDSRTLAFRDLNPQAPVHILVVPKEHLASAAEITSETAHLAAECFETIAKIAAQEGLTTGFRVITNSGKDAGQTVAHLHFHVLAKRRFGEKIV